VKARAEALKAWFEEDMAQVFQGFAIPFEVGEPLKGILAFDDDHHDFGSARRAVDLPERAYIFDDSVRAMTSSGLMYLDKVSYGTCMFCPDGFRVRASHHIEENPMLVCLWVAAN
jgi:hypothetical protein